MKSYALSHLADATLSRALETVIANERAATADVLAHIAEFDARKLFLPAGFPSMFTYCVDRLHLCEQAAFKRIRGARAARRFPAIFSAVADGRLHLSGVVLLSPHLTEDNAEELLAAATHKSKARVERLLAERFPRPDVPAWVAPGPAPRVFPPSGVCAPAPVEDQLSPGTVEGQQTPKPVLAFPSPVQVGNRAIVKPLSPQSFAVQFTMSQGAQEKLRYAQQLLGHQIPSGDIAQVFDRALDALIPKLEQARFAATEKPRPRPGRSTNPRHIPAHVKRAVWKRDRGRCTFVSEAGQRCPARARLEFDHCGGSCARG